MKIILDAMGGDNAPEAAVLGAIDAAKKFGAEITLVGRAEAILEVMGRHGIADLPEGVEIMGADDVVDMHDDPASIIHKRKNSSMVVGLKLLADGKGDAFVSAGSTGALLTGATLLVKRVKGIRRAAMAPAMPNKRAARPSSATAAPMPSAPRNFCCNSALSALPMQKSSWALRHHGSAC